MSLKVQLLTKREIEHKREELRKVFREREFTRIVRRELRQLPSMWEVP